MNPRIGTMIAPLTALFLLAGPSSAQPTEDARSRSAVLTSVSGQIRDLSLDSTGKILYCTSEGDVGRIDTTVPSVTVLATDLDGLPTSLRAVVETPTGDIATLHTGGDIWRLPGGALPVSRLYTDLWMIFETSDMIVDASGNFVICSKTPSVGTRGINWVDPTGYDWAYMLVDDSPCTMAADPVTGNLLMTDSIGDGDLRMIDAVDETRPATILDTTTVFNFDVNEGDGDIAVDVSGNAYITSGASVFLYDRSSGNTTIFGSGFARLRGVAIAASSGNVASASGWSLYLAAGGGPTYIHEFGDVEAPASVVATSLGTVPTQGIDQKFFGTLRVYDLAVDNDGTLLVGGDLWGNNEAIWRIDQADSFNHTVVADQYDGLAGRTEGIQMMDDGTIYALGTWGWVQKITEDPLNVTTIFSDPSDQVTVGKDMVVDRDGTVFIADREGFGPGEVLELSPQGIATTLVSTNETRGLTADPFTAGMLVSEWNCSGFCGSISLWDFGTSMLNLVPGLIKINYSNDAVWGDGDSVMDVEGHIYTCSEDDWRVTRYEPEKNRYSTFSSMYQTRISGVAIAASSPGVTSPSGWSLYVTEFDHLWEIPDVPPPAPRRLERNAPPVGELLGWFNRGVGLPRTMIADPAGDGLLVCTSAGSLERISVSTQAKTTLVNVPGSLDITGLAALSNGHIVASTTSGILFELDPASSYSWSLLYANPGGTLSGVRGITVDGQDDVLVVDRSSAVETAKLYRLSGGTLDFLANTARGLRPAIDPLTADVFVTQRGSKKDAVGEILRVDPFTSPAEHGHWRGDSFYTFKMDEIDGGIAFDADGNFYVAEGPRGRVSKIDRATGDRTVVAANFERPVAVALAPGRPGIAGAQGTSLFVLDEWAVFEIGVPGLPAPAPPATQPGLAPPADFRVTGSLVLGTNIPFTIESPPDAGLLYIIFPSFSGKVPGLPLAALGTPDPRILPSNIDPYWGYVGGPAMPKSIWVLDGSGLSHPATSIGVPNDPTLLDVDGFFDLVWVAIDNNAPNRVATVGGTGQIYLGN